MATTRSPRNPAGPQQPLNDPATKRNGRKPPRKKTFWDRVKAFFQFIFLLFLVFAIAVMAAVFMILKQAPSKVDLAFNPKGITEIYSADDMILAKYFVENRQFVPIDQIPLDLQHATVAFEDRRFYTHHGIDFTGIGRAVWSNLRHHDMHGEGASTITQQLARNLGVNGLTRTKSIERKLKEWLIANQIEHSYSKQQILEMYLNEINYGSGAFGVQAAAKTYFGKDVKNLSLPECALLAGLPNRPTFFNPYRDKDEAQKQRNIVLDWMYEEHYITQDQCQDAKDSPVKLASPHQPKLGSAVYRAPFFVSYVWEQLKNHYTEDYLKEGNLKVYTTLNYQMQLAAEQAVKNHLANQPDDGPSEACLVAMDPKTGEIKALVGGSNYKESQFNIATQGRRQPGSLFKAILYSAAINSGLVTEDTKVLDAPVSYPMSGGEDWTPKDDDGYTYNHVTLKTAMAMSINVPAVKVMKLIGPERVTQYARLMGIDSPLDPVLSLALGSSAVTPLEMVDAYATFPNGGNHVTPVSFTRVEDADGKLIDFPPPPGATRVLSQQTVDQLDDMLRTVVTDGTASRTPVADIADAHGKTGTTQDHKDTWFVGYTPRLVCGVWAGHPIHDKRTGKYSYGQAMGGNAWGATMCAPIWADFMKVAEPIFIKDQEKETSRWKKPGATPATDVDAQQEADDKAAAAKDAKSKHAKPKQDIVIHNADGTVTANIDNDTGLLAPPGSPNSSPVNFAAGTEPQTMAPQYADQVRTATPSRTSAPANGQSSNPSDSTTSPNSTNDNSTPDSDSNSGDTATTSPVPTPSVAPGATAPARTSDPSLVQPDTGTATPTPDSPSIEPPTIPAPEPPRAPPVRHHKPVEYVTVYINPDDGLLANQWTPEKVPKTFVKGTEPHRVTRMYGPPPGEH